MTMPAFNRPIRPLPSGEAPLHRGRGAQTNASGRFEPVTRESVDDGWDAAETLETLVTRVTRERPRHLITRNDSPDLGFEQSLNPYRGCEHGCSYCYARPTHAYLGLSPGLDFETRLVAKDGAAAILRRELAARGYRPRTLAMGTNTDPYQPIERQHRITRSALEVLAETGHPVGIVTKSALVTRDIDILAPMAARGLVKVAISVTTLDRDLARRMEPRASQPQLRLDAMAALAAAGIPVTLMVAPIIPGLNDPEIETIMTRAFAAGAREVGYVLLRLPLEIAELFTGWLRQHYPERAEHVLQLVRSTREGGLYDSAFHRRMSGTGPYAFMIGRRVEITAARLGFRKTRLALETGHFKPPRDALQQADLFETAA
ncbi:MAG: PA0069 family radical SAM protein [Hyphomicrobiales bacterium]|nr:PA0069 family radical SAM protein [Hyphomicrobiales bacterium]